MNSSRSLMSARLRLLWDNDDDMGGAALAYGNRSAMSPPPAPAPAARSRRVPPLGAGRVVTVVASTSECVERLVHE